MTVPGTSRPWSSVRRTCPRPRRRSPRALLSTSHAKRTGAETGAIPTMTGAVVAGAGDFSPGRANLRRSPGPWAAVIGSGARSGQWVRRRHECPARFPGREPRRRGRSVDDRAPAAATRSRTSRSPDPSPGRDRDRQGAPRPGPPRRQSSRRWSVRRGRLLGDPGHPPRSRAVRLRGGSLHRRPAGQARPRRGRSPGHPVSRRDRVSRGGPPDQAADGPGVPPRPPPRRDPQRPGRCAEISAGRSTPCAATSTGRPHCAPLGRERTWPGRSQASGGSPRPSRTQSRRSPWRSATVVRTA